GTISGQRPQRLTDWHDQTRWSHRRDYGIEGDAPGNYFLGDLVPHVEPEADRDPAEDRALPARLTEHPARFAVHEHEVIGPLDRQAHFRNHSFDGLGDGQADAQAQRFVSFSTPQQDAVPETAER